MRAAPLAFAVVACLGAAACGPSAPAKSGVGAAANGDAGATGASVAQGGPRKVDLEFTLNGRPFPLPLVHGTVGGVETLILVDTGANSHVIAGWLARKANLTLRQMGDTGTDHTGRAIETRRAPHPQVAITGWGDLPDEPMLVTDVPEAVSRLGIGAFLSPQQLATDDMPIILDFPHKEMRTGDKTTVPSNVGAALTLDPVRACLDEESPVKGRAFVILGKVEGQSVELLLDTGAHHSDLLLSSKPGKALLPKSEASKEQVYAASGKVTPRILRSAKVTVGAVEGTFDVDLIPGERDDFCPRDGVLAMDVLQSCELILTPKNVKGQCR